MFMKNVLFIFRGDIYTEETCIPSPAHLVATPPASPGYLTAHAHLTSPPSSPGYLPARGAHFTLTPPPGSPSYLTIRGHGYVMSPPASPGFLPAHARAHAHIMSPPVTPSSPARSHTSLSPSPGYKKRDTVFFASLPSGE